MRFGIIGSVFDRRPPSPARNHADGSALLELRSPWRAGLSGKHARPGESVSCPRRKAWENAFFESEFTHAALGAQLTAHPEGFLGLWRDLAGSEDGFPVEFLINSGESLQSFVQAREG